MHIEMAMNHSPARIVNSAPCMAQLAAIAMSAAMAKMAMTGL